MTMDQDPLEASIAAESPDIVRGEQRRILANAGKLSSAVGIGYFINLVGGLIIAGILGPMLLGVWKTVQLAVQYTQFLNLGTSYGVHKLSPALVSRGLINRYRKLMGVSLGFGLVLPLIGGAVLLTVAFLVRSTEARLALLTLSVVVPLQQFYHHAELALAIEKRFGAKARAVFGYTLVRVALSIALAAWLGLGGVLVAYVVCLIGASHYMITHSRMGLQLALRATFARRLIRVGLPITLIVLGELLLTTADKWIVTGVLGTTAMGLYNIAVLPYPLLVLLPVSLRQVVNVEMFDKFGRTRELGSVRNVYEQSTLTVALISPVVMGAVYLGVPWLVDWKLPKYHDSIFAVQWHAILAFSLLVMQTGTGILIVSGRERITFAAQLGVAALCACVSLAAIARLGVSFNTVLFIHGAGWALFSVAILYVIERLLGASRLWAAGRVAAWFFPMVYAAADLALVHWIILRAGIRPYSFAYAVIGGLLHLALCAPLLIYLERRTHSVSDSIRMIRRRLGL